MGRPAASRGCEAPAAHMSIKARPTFYRGTLLRSRLEAAAASHLEVHLEGAHGRDLWGRGWLRYEGQAFANQQHNYLPDFVLGAPDATPLAFFEVKPDDGRPWPEMRAVLHRMHVIRDTYPHAELTLLIGTYLGDANNHDFSWYPCYLNDPNLTCVDCR